MKARFEIFKHSNGAFGFRLVAPNGEIQGGGEGYTRREDAHRGAEDLKRNAAEAEIVDYDYPRPKPPAKDK